MFQLLHLILYNNFFNMTSFSMVDLGFFSLLLFLLMLRKASCMVFVNAEQMLTDPSVLQFCPLLYYHV